MTNVSAGSYDLNKFLHGGYERGVITSIYGPPGSGKTNFCLLALASQIKKQNNVIFMDTEGGFSIQRLNQIIGEADKQLLDHVVVLNPTTFSEQKESFSQLLKYLKDHVSLIIVDGMTMLYRLEQAQAREQGIEQVRAVNAELAYQLRTLSEIARKYDIAVIVTNQVYSFEGSSRMVAGDILQYWSKCLIELTVENSRRTAYLRKHRSLPYKSLPFQIYEKGIRKRGWINA